MSGFLYSSIGRLRLIAFLEGLSLIILVGIGMPLKYWLDNPSWVKFLGPVHGFLFVVFVALLINEAYNRKWSLVQSSLILLIGSFVPCGTFYVDKRWLKPLHA